MPTNQASCPLSKQDVKTAQMNLVHLDEVQQMVNDAAAVGLDVSEHQAAIDAYRGHCAKCVEVYGPKVNSLKPGQ